MTMAAMETARRAPAQPDTLEVRLKALTWVAPGVLSLRLTALDGDDLPPFAPGAHIDVHLPDGTVRQYSLCGDPADRRAYVIGVREVEGGRASAVIHRQLRPGLVLRIGTPRNNFPLAPSPNYLFVAGGIGVTPLIPMMRAAGDAGASWSLLFCARRAAEAPFLDEVEGLGGEVAVFATDRGARLDVERLAAPRRDTLLYCCGPEALMTAVEAATASWPDGSVRFEWFAARSRPEDETSGAFQVVCAQAGLTLSVPPEASVLSVLEAAGVEVPRSCEQGVCGTCEVRVLEGEVDHRDCILSEAEQAANEVMMTCVSRARSPRLVLDL